MRDSDMIGSVFSFHMTTNSSMELAGSMPKLSYNVL